MLWNGKAWLLDLLDVIEAANGIGICGLHWPTIHSFILSLSHAYIYIYIYIIFIYIYIYYLYIYIYNL